MYSKSCIFTEEGRVELMKEFELVIPSAKQTEQLTKSSIAQHRKDAYGEVAKSIKTCALRGQNACYIDVPQEYLEEIKNYLKSEGYSITTRITSFTIKWNR